MRIKSLLRPAAIWCVLITQLGYVAAQDVRDATGSASTTDTLVMQYYSLFRRLVHPPTRSRPPTDPQNPNGQTNPPQPELRAMLHRSLKFSDTEARVFDQIAEDCIAKTDKLDQQAQEIITAHRADVKAGKIPPTAPPPSSLQDLQKQRDDVVRNAIEQLRAQFGEKEFARLNEYFARNTGSSSSMRLPPPTQKPLPVEVKFALMNGDINSQPQFSAKQSFTVEVSMLNNSTEMISVKPSQLYQWLLLTKPSEPSNGPVPRNLMLSEEWLHPPTDEVTVDLPPNQLQVVARFKFGAGGIRILSSPGEYQLAVHPKVVYSQPSKSDFLLLNVASPFAFEIIQ